MGQPLAIGAFTSALAGCSLIYNPSNLPPAPGDATSDMEIIVDADPTMLTLTDIAPATINEGQGKGNGRPAVFVIRGENIAPDAVVTVTSQTNNPHFTVVAVDLAADHKFIAVQIVADVDDTLAVNTSNVLDVHVAQAIPGGGTKAVDLVGKVAITGLAELDDNTFSGAAGELLPLYSRVILTNRTITGNKDERAIIRSASSISVGALVVNADPANGSSGGTGGPGGCSGGAGGSDGDCGPASGHHGGEAGGGGGGGFGTEGTTADGSNAGSGGSTAGSATISSYNGAGITANRAGGGGGGGGLGILNLTHGGGGGGGGGLVELTAEGDVTAGAIDAKGGDGGFGLALTDGGGGGGAGGAIVVRSGGMLKTGMLTAQGGNGVDAGGQGADGRIRFDVARGTLPVGTPQPHRGPAFVDAPLIVTTAKPPITMVGTSQDGFLVYVVDHDGMIHDQETFAFGGDNMVKFTPTLFRGYNRLCVLLAGGERGRPEAEKCVDIALLP